MSQLDLPQRSDNPSLPAFSLPPSQTTAWVVETRPSEAETWLASLPLADSVQAAQQVYQALFTLNRMSLEANDRLVLMELYRKPVAAVASGLQPHFARLTLPLKPRLKQLADFLCQLHMEMANGYKHVLKAGLDESDPWENDAFLLAVERSIRYLGEVLLRSYQMYMPAPPGVWKEIHGFYRYTEQHDQAHRLLAIVGLDEGTTVARAYFQAVLLGLCGPYQLPQNECHQVNAFLARWAGKAEISSAIQAINPVGRFLIDFEADHPAVPFPRDVPLHPAPTLRVLNAVELARVVHDFSKRLQKGESPHGLGLGFECVGVACVDTLKRMLRFWGLAGRRQFSRRNSPQPLSLCVGINAVHFFCDGQRPFTQPLAPVAIPKQAVEPPDRLALEAESRDEQQVTTPMPELYRIDSRWQVRDESAGGLSLARSGATGVPIRVGDVLGIQNPVLNQWRIGVVRWVKSATTDHVEMGVEMLAPHAQPLAVRPAGTDVVPYSQALLLPPIEALRQPATLLVARGTCQPGEDIELVEGESPPRRVRVLNMVERSSAFAQVVFADVARAT
jgi:hypothetical protein